MKRIITWILTLFVITTTCFAFPNKPPTKTGAAGAPDNGETCISCHGSSGNGSLVVSNLPNQYKSGEKYTLSVKLSQSGRQRWGFILTALDKNGNQAGTFESNDANTQVFSASGRQYIGHTSSGTAAGQSNSNTWLMDWIAPAVDTGKISFYASGNAANNNGKNTGDNGYKTEITIEAEEVGVNIPDPNLRAALEKALGKNEGDAITKEDLAGLKELVYEGKEGAKIADLTGLEHCTNLDVVELTKNVITDLSPLSSLTSLQVLILGENSIEDIRPIGKLTNLIWLKLYANQIENISALSGMTKLESLDLNGNLKIKDISPISQMTSLRAFSAVNNQIEDITPLRNLINLEHLDIWGNQISEISALAGLSNLTKLYLKCKQDHRYIAIK